MRSFTFLAKLALVTFVCTSMFGASCVTITIDRDYFDGSAQIQGYALPGTSPCKAVTVIYEVRKWQVDQWVTIDRQTSNLPTNRRDRPAFVLDAKRIGEGDYIVVALAPEPQSAPVRFTIGRYQRPVRRVVETVFDQFGNVMIDPTGTIIPKFRSTGITIDGYLYILGRMPYGNHEAVAYQSTGDGVISFVTEVEPLFEGTLTDNELNLLGRTISEAGISTVRPTHRIKVGQIFWENRPIYLSVATISTEPGKSYATNQVVHEPENIVRTVGTLRIR